MNETYIHGAHALLSFLTEAVPETLLEVFFPEKLHVHEVEDHIFNIG